MSNENETQTEAQPVPLEVVDEALAAFRSASRGGVVGGPEEQMRAALVAALPALRRQIAEEAVMIARKSHLTTAQFAILNDACIPVAEAFDSSPYLVGSATEKPDFRDVDLRLILTDEDFDHWFSGREMLWSLVCMAIGQHLASVTALPIDFQIQRMTEANENHPGASSRHPMGMRRRPLAGGGDATNFGAR